MALVYTAYHELCIEIRMVMSEQFKFIFRDAFNSLFKYQGTSDNTFATFAPPGIQHVRGKKRPKARSLKNKNH